MITRLAKVQLMVFALITLLGGIFVGGRYAGLDRLVVDRTFAVTVQLADSGGLFEGSQVTYRGVGVGRVDKLIANASGLQARLEIQDSAPPIPADLEAVVANKSAVGEQYLDLQPRSDAAPYLAAGAHIASVDTQTPIPTTKLLVDLNDLVGSVNTDSLKTVIDELGTAFAGTGPDLGRIIDNSAAFIGTADDNFDQTRALIRNSTSVLQTQLDKQDALSSFSRDLALFSDTLAGSDADLRRLLADGPGAAKQVRQVVAENSKNLGTAIDNAVTANKPIFENTQALRSLFILFPYLLEGAPSTLVQDPATGNWDVAFGLVAGLPGVNQDPAVCLDGYRGHRGRGAADGLRPPRDVSPRDLDLRVNCTDRALVARNPDKTSTTARDSWQ